MKVLPAVMLVTAAVVLMAAGCARQADEAEGVFLRKPTADEIGMSAHCPVMQTDFTVTEDTDVIDDGRGGAVFTCCPACAPEVLENPGEYGLDPGGN